MWAFQHKSRTRSKQGIFSARLDWRQRYFNLFSTLHIFLKVFKRFFSWKMILFKIFIDFRSSFLILKFLFKSYKRFLSEKSKYLKLKNRVLSELIFFFGKKYVIFGRFFSCELKETNFKWLFFNLNSILNRNNFLKSFFTAYLRQKLTRKND